MEATLQSHAVRQLKRILVCLSKFGDELNLNATHDSLQLSTVNQSRSAFCLFTLSSHDFFSTYRLSPPSNTAFLHSSTQSTNRSIKCKLPVRAVLAVLSNASTQPGSLERLEMRIVDPGDGLRGKSGGGRKSKGSNRETTAEAEIGEGIEARLILKLVCKHGILKTHSLHLGSSKFLVAVVDPDTTLSSFTLSSKTLREWSDHFFFSLSSSSNTNSSRHANAAGGGQEDAAPIKAESELGWLFDGDEVRVKTFDVGIGTGSGSGGGARPIMATEVKCGLDDFEEYYVKDPPVVLAFPMKEFRAAFSLADQFSIPLATSFSVASQPISISLKVQGIEAEFAIATIARDLFSTEIAAKKLAREKECKPKVNGETNGERAESIVQGSRKRDSQIAGLDLERDGNGDPRAGASGSRSHSGRNAPGKRRTTLDFSQHDQGHPVSIHGNSQVILDTARNPEEQEREPLFLPSASQDMREFSQREEVLQAGLGLENMDDSEIAGLMDMDEDDEMELRAGGTGGDHGDLDRRDHETNGEGVSLEDDHEPRQTKRPPEAGESVGRDDDGDTALDQREESSEYDEDETIPASQISPPKLAGATGQRQIRAIFDD